MVLFIRILLIVTSGLAAIFFFYSGVPFLALISLAISVCFMLKTTYRFFRIALNVLLGLTTIVLMLAVLVLVYNFYSPSAGSPGPRLTSQEPPKASLAGLELPKIVHLPEHHRGKGPDAQPIPFSIHFRKWADSQRQAYSGTLAVAEKHYQASRSLRDSLPVPAYNDDYAGYWRQVYRSLAYGDLNRMPRVYAMFDSLRLQRRLTSAEFADVVVSCVQEIDYVLLHEFSCQEIDSISPVYRELHRQSPCMANVRFGLQSPAEFMYNLKADCDTRVILLYDILSHFGIDVAVLVSENYGHSVLGVNLPARGNFVPHLGKKYYVWETTQKGYPLGEIDPAYEDMNYWTVAMASE
jgi:hypothetical protein